MTILKGRPISPGYAEGTAVVYKTTDRHTIPRYAIAPSEVPAERDRFRQALECSWRELEDLERRLLAELGRAQAAIFSAHLALLKDRQFAAKVEEQIGRKLVNVEQALDWQVADFAKPLSAIEDEYLRERAQDILDVGHRVLRHLAGGDKRAAIHLPSHSVIVADQLIETPSAIFALNEILDLVDFVSIGTNDLTQFILGGDRNARDVLDDCSALHPSVLRAIGMIVDTAREKDVPVCVCGEAAGDPSVACLLVGLGVRALSMSPSRAARVRYTLRRIHCRDAEDVAAKALRSSAIDTVRTLVDSLTRDARAQRPVDGPAIATVPQTLENCDATA